MKEKNSEFSTFDAVRILDVDRSRLVHWMRGKFIPLGKDIPWGRGFKTAFSLFDLYSIALFRECVDFSLSREVAKRYWEKLDWEDVINEEKWLLKVENEMGTFIRNGQIASMYDWSDIKMLVTAPESASNKSTTQEMKKLSRPEQKAKTKNKNMGKLLVGETTSKVPLLPQTNQSETGGTISLEKDYQFFNKAEVNKGWGIMFIIDLKRIVDEVNIRL